MVSQKTYNLASGVIFLLVGLMHLFRVVMGWDLIIGTWNAPMYLSWIGLVVAFILAYFALKRF
jgi:hypothetical protein